MDFVNVAKVKTCERQRYYTGKDKSVGQNNPFSVEDPTGVGAQLMGGRIYLCSLYAYMFAYLPAGVAADIWLMVYDCSVADSIAQLPNPRIVIRVPIANQPATAIFECAESESDEVQFADGGIQKVGKYFENGVRVYASSSGTQLSPVASWGYITSADFNMLKMAPGKVV